MTQFAAAQTTLTATGGTGGYTWSLTNAPPRLTISGDGVLTANLRPTLACLSEPCSFSYTYKVSDSAGDSYSKSAAITANPAPLYYRTPHTLPSTSLRAPYEQTIVVGRGWGTCDGFTLMAGHLPRGISLVGTTCKQYAIITGRATTAGRYAFEIRAGDPHGDTTSSWFYITVK